MKKKEEENSPVVTCYKPVWFYNVEQQRTMNAALGISTSNFIDPAGQIVGALTDRTFGPHPQAGELLPHPLSPLVQTSHFIYFLAAVPFK